MSAINPEKCPLCGGPNECQICSPATHKGPCWCARVEIPDALLTQVPLDLRNKSCICNKCVTEFHRAKNPSARQNILPGDFYFDGGMMVFTVAYHLRRGWCCGSGCRHCPYPKPALA
ncbi:MAG TPA: cysteine-rich CWC family protein [Verrucomicrobiae bacterium]|nr:cysteine-rich CWC family protein [Verrucomicrobiae bacterium]